MKKKTISRVLSVLMAVVLIAIAPLFLTACGTQATLYASAKAAAKDYYGNHKDYNFADTTYVYEQKDYTKSQFDLEYYANAEATEKTTGTFTEEEEDTEVCIIYVKNVGERVAVVVDIATTCTKNTYDTDAAGLLKEVHYTSKADTQYVLSFLEDGENATYYLTKEYQFKENDEEPEVSKQYREYANEANYLDVVEDVMHHVNRYMVERGYFSIISSEESFLFGNMITEQVNGKDVKAVINYDTFDIDGSEVVDIAMNLEIGFNNNKLGTVKTKTSYIEEEFENVISQTLSVEFSANNVNTEVSLTGATNNSYLYIDGLPRVEIGIIS